MSSFSTLLGLSLQDNGLQPPSHVSSYILFHFLFAYAGISSRPWKIYHRLDHNVSPRGDLAKYGPKAVSEGKISQKLLNQMIRVEAAHANSVENFPLLVGALVWASFAGVETTTINRAALGYTVARLVYAASYIFITKHKYSNIRGISWWAGNIICLRLIWLGGRAVNKL